MLILGIMLAAATPAVAAETKESDGKVVCRSYGKTESRIGRKRICKTKAEWATLRTQEMIEMEKFKGEGLSRRRAPGGAVTVN